MQIETNRYMSNPIAGYVLTVHRGARAGLVRKYAPYRGKVARRAADRLDNEYGAICASVRPVFATTLESAQ